MKTPSNFIGVTALLSLTGCPEEAPSQPSSQDVKRPNLVFVFADQFRYDAIGANGNAQAITPRLDEFCSQGRMYKLTFYNESAHIPMIVRYPDGGVERGTTDVCMNTPDIMPTLLSMMGLGDKIPEEVEGQDLSFALKGGKGREPKFAFLQGMGHTHLWKDGFEWRCIRSKDYLYARYLRDGKELLFDQRNDPCQMNDLASDPSYARVLKKYRAMMEDRMEELGDEFHTCTWYRDHWMYKDYSIKACAKGEFGPVPPLEPIRH